MNWWQRLFRSGKLERQLEAEVRFHLEQHEADLVKRGVPPAEARRRARLAIGGPEQVKEECRDARGTRWLEDFWADLCYAARTLRKQPAFATAALLTLALGIGAAAGIFSVVNAVLLHVLPFNDPAQLVAIFQSPEGSKGPMGWAVSGPDVLDWQRDSRSFTEIAATLPDAANMTGRMAPQHVNGMRVTSNYFDLLGSEAGVGRVFSPNEYPDEKEVIVSYALWRSTLGGGNILGSRIALDGEPFTIIGVMPATFHDPRTWMNPQADYWIHLPKAQLEANRGNHMYAVFGRLRLNVALTQAREEMDLIGQREAQEFADTNKDMGVRVSPLQQVSLQTFEEGRFQSVRPAILLLQCAAGFLLLIACANVASLLLSQSLKRHKELALRAAMGAGRGRLIRQLLTESVLLSVLASAGGVLLADWFIRLLVALAPKGYLPPTANIQMDVEVLGFAVGAATLTGVLFGLIPALRASRPCLNEDLKHGTPGAGDSRSRVWVRGALVVFELAATFLLLAGGGLMMRGLGVLLSVNPGFGAEGFFTAGVNLPALQYKEPEQIVRFFSAVQERVHALPGIAAVAFTSSPAFEVTNSSNVNVEGYVPRTGSFSDTWAQICIISTNFFHAAGIPLIQGRDFTPADLASGANVAIVSQAFAEHFWPQQSWLGKRVRYGGGSSWLEVIGIAGNVRQMGLSAQSEPELYLPLNDVYADGETSMNIVARSALPTPLLAKQISREVQSVDAGIPLAQPRTGHEILREWTSYLRYRAGLLASFAVMALVIAGIGLFGVISYIATQRTREIGIRVALGGQRRDIFRLVLFQGARLALAGLGLGSLCAIGLVRLVASLVYGVKPYDPLTFSAVAVLLTAVELSACYLPARRAMRVDPLVALRFE